MDNIYRGDMLSKMILGTVQLGIPYGINNVNGKPTYEQAMEILDYAYQHGVDCLDTASAYGDSENIIGDYIRKNNRQFKVCTKFPADIRSKEMVGYCEQKIEDFGINEIYVYYLHRFEQCKDKEIMSELCRLKELGKILKIGVSIYEPQELVYITNCLSDVIDVVQIPFNLLDNGRWLSAGILENAVKNRIEIYSRSVYLQGLLLAAKTSDKVIDMGVQRVLGKLSDIAEQRSMHMDELAVAYVNSIGEISNILVGCETINQLIRNVQIFENDYHLTKKIKKTISTLVADVGIDVVDPRKWIR